MSYGIRQIRDRCTRLLEGAALKPLLLTAWDNAVMAEIDRQCDRLDESFRSSGVIRDRRGERR